MALRQRGWTALAFGAAAAITGLRGWASSGKANQRAPALRGGQPGELDANRGGCDLVLLWQRLNEAGNHAPRPGIRGMSVQMPVLRLLARLRLIALFGLMAFLAASISAAAAAPTLTTLVNFNGTNGKTPDAGLIADSAGDLFGTTAAGGPNGDGTVFEIPKTASGYGPLMTLTSFNDPGQGTFAVSGLTIDAAGNLYGTIPDGGANFAGSVFEIAKTGSGYTSTPTTLATFNGTNGRYPYGGSLIPDAAGDLFGTTTAGGANEDGTVFELVNNGGGSYTLKTLVSFNGAVYPYGLIADAAGNLFGTTNAGGANNDGTVFEIAKTGGSYASTPTTLVSFDGANGANPSGGLILDAAENLFGTTGGGGANNDGTVFELVSNGGGSYTLTTLVSFDLTNGQSPSGGLIADAAGNLFGTTFAGGANGNGTVFEIAKTGDSYASTPTTLVNFKGSDGNGSEAGLIFDAGGNLFGTTTSGGASNQGTVFELAGAGTALSANPQTSDFNADGKSDILWQSSNGAVAIWEMNGTKAIATGGLGNPGPSWQVIGAGDFFGTLYSDIMWQNLSGQVDIWEMNGLKVIASGSPGNPGPAWHVVGSGDFNGDGYSDILFQNTNGAVAIWEMNGFKMVASAVLGNPGPAWHIVGTGDFNGDGKSDILWQNTDGQADIWLMNGTTVISETFVGANPGPSWHIVGTGDFNGDGKSDILWQNTDGQADIWLMNGTTVISETFVGANPGSSWHIVGTGDFNGDGKSDILWQNTDGAVSIWEMNGTKVIATGSPGNPGPSWHAIGE